jgi:phospholipid-binding lipoprotein MlaA
MLIKVPPPPPADDRRGGPTETPGDEVILGWLWPDQTVADTVKGPCLLGAAGLALVCVLVSGPGLAQDRENDPLEPVNRAVFEFNRVLDGLILEPAARMYRTVAPEFVRDGVENFLVNLRTPIVLANDLLQGEFARAEKTLGRFMLNTILGFGGLIDVGGRVGMPERHSEDFGQTLAVYGVGEGPYLVLPLLGPSNPRDAVGYVVDLAFDPVFFLAPNDAGYGRFGAEALTFREQNIETIEELERSSIDLYAATRTLVRQLRANEIRNGAAAPFEDIYDENIYDEDIYQLDEGGDEAFEGPDDPLADPEDDDAQ